MTPTPRERAEQTYAGWYNGPGSLSLIDCIERAIHEAISDQTAALQAALEDLAKAYSDLTSEQIAHGKTMQERDGLAQRLRYECPDCCGTGAVETSGPYDGQVELMACARCGPAYDELAAHDRQVAARVLRKAAANESLRFGDWVEPELLTMEADAYERGEREVPSE